MIVSLHVANPPESEKFSWIQKKINSGKQNDHATPFLKLANFKNYYRTVQYPTSGTGNGIPAPA
jgi:hypothetical protein